MRKILYISGTRADYGLMRQALFSIRRRPGLKVEIAVCGMHLMPEFGLTISEISRDRFKIHKINAVYRGDDKKSMALFLGEFTLKLTNKIERIKPDFILVLGDRAEMLAAAIVGAYLMIPVAHIHGGDVSSTVDEIARHAITKLSHIHLVSTANAARRVKRMGEPPWRVHLVGAPGIDGILGERLFSREKIAKKYNLDLSRPVLLVIQHPVAAEAKKTRRQITETMEAVKELKYKAILIYPNCDAGGRRIIEVIERYRKYPFIQIYKSVPRADCLSLMKVAGAIIGNSSAGIIEAPAFHLPAVNIGGRQDGRERTANVLDVDYDKDSIKKAVKKALCDNKFRLKVKKCKSPYGNGKAGAGIAKILSRITINDKLLQKRMTY